MCINNTTGNAGIQGKMRHDENMHREKRKPEHQRSGEGRYVFQGNDVRDQNAEVAVFESLLPLCKDREQLMLMDACCIK